MKSTVKAFGTAACGASAGAAAWTRQLDRVVPASGLQTVSKRLDAKAEQFVLSAARQPLIALTHDREFAEADSLVQKQRMDSMHEVWSGQAAAQDSPVSVVCRAQRGQGLAEAQREVRPAYSLLGFLKCRTNLSVLSLQ